MNENPSLPISLLPPEYAAVLKTFRRWRRDSLIVVDGKTQRLTLYRQNRDPIIYPVSTARNGFGERENSFQTPRGLHRIHRVIGVGEPAARIFRARRATRETWTGESGPGAPDLILGRILWLEGLEAGRNRRGRVDSRKRFIYIHGTNHPDHLGHPASIGCIRMRGEDVMDLADRLGNTPGTLCLIEGA